MHPGTSTPVYNSKPYLLVASALNAPTGTRNTPLGNVAVLAWRARKETLQSKSARFGAAYHWSVSHIGLFDHQEHPK